MKNPVKRPCTIPGALGASLLTLGLIASSPAVSAQSNQPVSITPAINLPLLDAENRLSINFEARSNRLKPNEAVQLDRLAKLITSDPDSRLRIHVPYDGDQGTKRFTASRLLVLDQELANRGVDASRVSLHTGGWATGPIVLTVVWPNQYKTLEQMPGTAAADFQPVAQSQAETPQPMPISPAPATATADDSANLAASAAGSAEAPALEVVEQKPIWTAESGRTLYQVLTTWAANEGWTVAWNSDREYPVEAGAEFTGDFIEVCTALIEGFAAAKPAPLAQFFKGNRVLLITSGEGR